MTVCLKAPMNKRNALQWILSGVTLAALAGMTAGCSENKPSFGAIDITGADYARDFSLTDHNGQARSLKDFSGKVVVLEACNLAVRSLIMVLEVLAVII